MKKKFLLMMMLSLLFTAMGTSVLRAQNVAKVDNTEYATIDEAIAAWTNGTSTTTTLTLLTDVTLSDVVTIKSTEHHILNLGTYTMTAASGKNAFVIKACGTGDAERSAITINADATNPGGIDAGSKCVVYYKYADGGISGNDRPIIKINGGVFTGSTSSWGTAGIYTIGTAARKCATVNIAGGTFDCSIVGSGKSKLIVSGGLFNYTVSSQGDSTCSRLISGGTFKSFGFMTADDNNTKFWIGTSMGNSNVGMYVDDDGYLVVGGPVVDEPNTDTNAGIVHKASTANYGGWNSCLKYSSAKDNGLYCTSVEEALADNNETGGSVTVYVDELDMTGISYKGTIVVPVGNDITITNVPEDCIVKFSDDTVLTPDESGNVYTKIEVATLDELQAALAAENELPIIITETIVIPADKTVTIDLNGKTVTRQDEATNYAINNLGTLTIQDTKGNGSINARGIYNGYGNGGANVATAKITVLSGTINAKGTNGGGAAIFNYGVADIQGGTFTSVSSYAIALQTGSTMTIGENAIITGGINSWQSTLTITGGTISNDKSEKHVVYAGESDVTINGGTFHNNNSGNATIMASGSTAAVEITGGTFTLNIVDASSSYLIDATSSATYTISGGSFTGGIRAQGGTKYEITGGTFTNEYGNYNVYEGGDINISGGTFTGSYAQKFATDNLAEGYELGANGTVVAYEYPIEVVFSDGHTKGFETLTQAMGYGYSGGEKTQIIVHKDIEESMSSLEGNIVTDNPEGVTIKNTIVDEWIYCSENFTIGEGVTYDATGAASGLFMYAKDAVINGTVLTDCYYQRYTNTKLTINEPGSMTVKTETFILRYTAGDGEAGIYINGDNNDETTGLNAAVIYFYQGCISAKNANIKVGTYWQTNETDNEGSANLVLDNSKMKVTVNEHNMKATGNSTVTLTNGSNIDVAGGYEGINVSMDETSSMTKNGVSLFVAKIGENNYQSLQTAINAVQDGETITLIDNVTVSVATAAYNDGTYIDGVRYTGDKSFTVDFNGKTVTDDGCVNDYLIYINNKGEKASEITFTNGTIVSKNGCWSAVCVNSSPATQNVVLNLNGMNITNSNDAEYSGNPVVRVRDLATVNVNDGTIITSNGASYGVAANTDGSTVNINEGATIIQQNSGTTGGNSVFAAVGGKGVINIKGGTITSDRYGVHTMTTGTPVINISGGTITAPVALKSSTNGGNGELATINVTGGTINGTLETNTENGKIVVSGGTFSEAVKEEYCAEGYVPVKNADGTYGVELAPVAEVGENTYRTFAEAAAAAQAGDEIKLLANIEGNITVPANVTLNGNGFAISGGIFAEGDITFAGVTTAADFDANVANTAVNIPAGASLQLTGTARLVIGHGATFNITGTIEDAKTADKATLVPSLKIAAGASITGNGVTFNVNNAYIVAEKYCSSKNSNANGTFNFNINNSIWDQTGNLQFSAPTNSMDPTVNFNLANSVLTTTSHVIFSVTKGEVVIDNSKVNEGVYRQLENRSTMTVKNGSVVNGAVATSENAKNPGTIIVENATYAVTGEFSGSDLGTGTIVYKKGATISAGSITKANIQIDATGMAIGDVINFTADLSKFTGTLSVINNDNLEAEIIDGKISLVEKPVAKIGETKYATLEAAFKAATSGCTIEILSNVTIDEAWDNRSTGAKFTVPVTINGNDNKLTFKGTVSDGGNYHSVFRFQADATVKNLTIDLANATANNNRVRAISSSANLVVEKCSFIGNNNVNNARAIIFGEGAGANVGNLEISITDSEFINWTRGITDNENAQDVKTVTITGNTLTSSAVYVSAKETVTFTGNTVSGAYVNIRSYSDENNLSVIATGNTLEENTVNNYNYIYAKNIEAQEEFTTENPPVKVSTKAELDAAINAAKDGDVIEMTADIDYGTSQLAIAKAITLDLGGKTLTTRNAYGGMSIKNNPTIKNGNIVHASNTAAIKVWNATAFEDLVIDVQGKGDANKTIGGIVLQSGTETRVGSIKNVTIKGDALTNGIETYNCGDAEEDVIGSMENVNIDAVGTAMLISAPCGTATNCTFDGGVNGIEIWIKGNYSASLGLVDCDVVGGVFAHDEFSSNPEIVNNGTLNLTADEVTTGAGVDDVTLTLARVEAENVEGVLEVVMEQAEAKVNNTYYQTLAKAVEAAQDGEEIDLLKNVALTSTLLLTKNNILDGNGFMLTPAGGFPSPIDGNNAVIVLAANMSGYEANRTYTVKNLTIEGFSTSSRIVRANFCNATIQDCSFVDNTSESIITSAYAVLNVAGNTFTNNTASYAVINVGSDVSDGTALVAEITGNKFYNNEAAIAGIFLASSADVTGNHFKDNTHTGDNANAAAILAGPYTGNMAYTVNIKSNAFEKAMSKGGTALPSVFAEDWSANYGSTTSFDLSLNYWDGNEPEVGTAYKTSGENPQVTVKSYYKTYTDGTLGGLVELPQGNNFNGYTRTDAIWGEVWGNAKESFVVKVLDANGNEMGTTSLNNIGGIFNGNVNVTWTLLLNAESNTDEYWTMEWTTAPTINNMPAKVELWVDGVKVSGGPVVLNGPDNINMIYAATANAEGKLIRFYNSIETIVNNEENVNVVLVRDVTGSFETFHNVTLYSGVEGGASITNTYSADYTNFNKVIVKNGVTLNMNNVFSTTAESVNTIEGTMNVVGVYYHSSDAKTEIKNGGKVTTGGMTIVRYNNNPESGIYIYGDGDDATIEFSCQGDAIGAYSGTFYAEDAVVETKGLRLDYKKDNSEESDSYAQINAKFVDTKLDVSSELRLYKDAALTLNGATVTAGKVQIRENATPTINIDNSTIKANSVENLTGATWNAVMDENGYVTFVRTGLAGGGTEANPYLINNLEDLVFFRDQVNTYTSDKSNQFRGKFVKLTNDIDLQGINWTPIGTNSIGDHAAFLGTFYGEKADGTIPTISNLYINANGDHLGFFARVGNHGDESCTPTIKNIKFNNVDVSSNTTTGHGGSYVAGVIANAGGNSVISNIEVTGDVYVVGYGYIGGIVGHGYPDIDNCHVIANEGSYIQSHYWCCGGIIGYAGEGGTPITNSSVSGVDIWASLGGAAAVAGLLQDGNRIENVSASNVNITSNSDYCMGYIAGNGEESTLTEISIENVTATANGNPITVTDAVAQIGNSIYFNLQAALNAAVENETITLLRDIKIAERTVIDNRTLTIDGNGKTIRQDENFDNTIAMFDIYGGKVTINNVIFDGVKEGAVVRTVGTEFAMDNVTAQNCEHTVDQGLFRLLGQNTITNSKFLNNNCSMVITLNYDDDGESNTPQLVENCLFEGNECNSVAALYYVEGASCTIKNSEFVKNTVNCNNNGATVYLGFTENNVVTGNIFQENNVVDASSSTRVAGAIFFGYEAEIENNVFVGNTASNANNDVLGQICTSTYYDCTIDLSGNYWGGEAPKYGEDYTVQHTAAEHQGVFQLDNYYKTFTTDENGNVVLGDIVNMNYVAQVGKFSYETLADAFAAAENETITLLIDTELSEMITIPNGKTVTLDLNGKTITGTDTTSKNFSIIDNRGNLTITDSSDPSTGKITLTATTNSGWSRYSAVIANNPGGKLIIENGTLEHLGGTDMAYGIDNLTNGKGTYAETVINGGTIKSTYRGIRQFLNGTEAQNILTVNGGTIEGANKSIWMQDPNKNANTGTLTVGENAQLKGDVYLYVTPNSTSWPVEVSIAAEALQGESTVMTANLPVGVDVQNINGTYGVVNVVAQIGDVKYQSLADAATAAQSGETIQLIWAEGNDPISMAATFVGDKTVTITGTADVDWSKDWFFVGRGGEGDGHVIFDNANLTSTSVGSNSGLGLNVSCKKEGESTTNDGEVEIINSNIQLDYLIGKGNIKLDNSKLEVYEGFAVGARPASETGGVQRTVTMDITNGSNVIVDNHNGQGLGHESNGIMNIDATSTFETKRSFLITANGTMNNAGTVTINGTLTNNGTINLTDVALTGMTIDGTGTTYFYNTVNFYGNNNITTNINGAPFELIVNEDATLLISRFVLGYDRAITVYGNIEDAHNLTAEQVASMTPSLKFNSTSGVSVGGTATGRLTAKDAYLEFGNSSWKNSYAEHTWSFENCYVSATSFGNNNEPGAVTSTWNVTFDNSVLAAKNYIKNGKGVTYNFTNGSVATTGSLRIDGTLNVDANSSVTTTGQQNNVQNAVDEHGGINGTINIDGTLTIGSNSATQLEVLDGEVNVTETGNIILLDNNTLTLDADSEMRSCGNITGAITAAEGADVEITGGTYTMDVNEWCHEYYDAIPNGDGTWTVEQVMYALVRDLQEGWSWFSSFINIDGEAGLTKIKDALGENGVQVKDAYSGSFIQYTSASGWKGLLNEASSKAVYSIKTINDGDDIPEISVKDFTIKGAKVDPSLLENTVYINKGWNYIAYPLDQVAGLDVLSFTPAEGDVIKSKESSSMYWGGGWISNIDMTPGEGYMYKSNDNATKSFNFAYPTRSAVDASISNNVTNDYYWSVNAHKYPSNMTIVAMLNIDNELVKDSYEIAAFANGECRGRAQSVYVESLDTYVLVLTVHGEDVENITFKYYDVNSGAEYELSNIMVYSNDAIVGSVDEPYMFNLDILNVDEASINEVNVYPNPTTTNAEIDLNATCDKVEVFNALGVKVAEYSNVDSIDALETAGVYVIRVTIDGNARNCRLIVK